MKRRMLGCLVGILATFGLGSSASAAFLLNFADLPQTSANGQPIPYPGPYLGQGVTLSATGGFNINVSNATGFSAGATGLAPIAGSSVDLRLTNGGPFSLTSIALARNFLQDPAPVVTFTGTKVGGGTVSQTLTVTTGAGVSAFQTFAFVGFDNLASLAFTQPNLSANGPGLVQFTNLAGTPVPEPSGLLLSGSALGIWAAARLARKRIGGRLAGRRRGRLE